MCDCIRVSLMCFARYYVQTVGAHVNVFVDHSQIVQLACLRKGIWGTNELFGRVVTFGVEDETPQKK
jgi:hypothetical protein